MKVDPEILAKIRCPVCRSNLEGTDTEFICTNPSCNAHFPVVNGVPILIDEANSLFSLAAYSSGSEVHLREHGSAITSLAQRLPRIGRNPKAAENYKKFAQLLIASQADVPKALVIGAGEARGTGMESLAAANVQLINTDVALTPATQIVLDAHSIPFDDETFDGVVAQAVLEHVLDPQKCVAEFYRVVKTGGFVYVEVPFMQQVHGGAYDFLRFSHLGLLNLFQRFEEIDSGSCGGPGMALAWSIQSLFLSFTTHSALRLIIKGLAALTLFPLKYLDYFLMDRPGGLDAASGVFYMGRKVRGKICSPKEILAKYRGAMRMEK
jgi:SAM-dependent methyltransferase/uncharacterized protein YbaR (Trm112 family)